MDPGEFRTFRNVSKEVKLLKIHALATDSYGGNDISGQNSFFFLSRKIPKLNVRMEQNFSSLSFVTMQIMWVMVSIVYEHTRAALSI